MNRRDFLKYIGYVLSLPEIIKGAQNDSPKDLLTRLSKTNQKPKIIIDLHNPGKDSTELYIEYTIGNRDIVLHYHTEDKGKNHKIELSSYYEKKQLYISDLPINEIQKGELENILSNIWKDVGKKPLVTTNEKNDGKKRTWTTEIVPFPINNKEKNQQELVKFLDGYIHNDSFHKFINKYTFE